VKLLDSLRREHERIESVVGALGTFVERRARGEGDPGDGHAFLAFFRLYAGTFHHAREEDVLFTSLVADAGLPSETGPIPSFVAQHHEMAATLDELAPLLVASALDGAAREALVRLATRHRHALLQHIDAENSVLFPESEARLRRSGVAELPDRPPTAVEAEAGAAGERLAALYPPRYDRDALRGDGCVICPSLGTTCAGVEREWWNDSEWESFSNRDG